MEFQLAVNLILVESKELEQLMMYTQHPARSGTGFL